MRRVVAAGIAIFLVLTACSAWQQRVQATAPRDTREGRTSVRILQDEPTNAPPSEVVAERITAAFASDENRLPEYPPYALKAGCRQGIIPIRLFIGSDGNLAKASPVPGRSPAEDQCHSAFWAASWSAVQAWRFSPAFRQTPRAGPDLDGDGRPDFTRWEQTPIMVYLDFEFTFSVVDGKGQVLAQ